MSIPNVILFIDAASVPAVAAAAAAAAAMTIVIIVSSVYDVGIIAKPL